MTDNRESCCSLLSPELPSLYQKWLRARDNISASNAHAFCLWPRLPPSSTRRRLTCADCYCDSVYTEPSWVLCGSSIRRTWKPSSGCVALLAGRARRSTVQTMPRSPASPARELTRGPIACSGSGGPDMWRRDRKATARGRARSAAEASTDPQADVRQSACGLSGPLGISANSALKM